MDSLSQAVLGAACTHAVVGKPLGHKALFLGAALGTLPDLDVLIRYGNVVADFTMHRGFSHSVFVLSAASIPIAWILQRFTAFKGVGFMQFWFAVWLALVTHPLLDAFTVYGTQLFWPLPRVPESWASLFIIDPLYTLPLLLTFIWILFRKPYARYLSVIGLSISTGYIAWTLVAKNMVEQQLHRELRQQGIMYLQAKAIPSPGRFYLMNTLYWRGLVIGPEHFYETYSGPLRRFAPLKFGKARHNHSWMRNLQQNWSAQRLAWFSNGYYRLSDQKGKVVWSDLRMVAFEFAIADIQRLDQPYLPHYAPR